MKLPNVTTAIVSRHKIVDYLLSETHKDGRGKAKFFSKFDFNAENWDVLATALKTHALENEVVTTEASPFGVRYIIEGELQTPAGRTPDVRAVWFIEKGGDTPALITAYPVKRK